MGLRKTLFFLSMIFWASYYTGFGGGICVSWVAPYRSIPEMFDDSTLVIRGIPISAYQAFFKWETNHQIVVLEVLKGKNSANIIVVPQMGTHCFPQGKVEPPSFPLFQRGEELILFLKKSERGSNIYMSAGGPQGSYKVVESEVYPVGSVFWSGLNSNGTGLSKFLDYLNTL